MQNALWIFFALPQWYFESITVPFLHPVLTGIPASGIVALALGIVAGLIGAWNSNLLWILASVGASQAYVAITGLFRGQMTEYASDWPFYCLMAVQLAIMTVLLWRARGKRVAAGLLSWFGITYALYAGVIGQMALSDTWL